MNSRQKASVWLGVAAIIGSSLYPPWSEPRYTLDTDAKAKIVTHIREMEQSGKAEEDIRGYVAEARRTYGHPQSFRWLFDSSVNGGKLAHVDLPNCGRYQCRASKRGRQIYACLQQRILDPVAEDREQRDQP
jgi:hypothetical protein